MPPDMSSSIHMGFTITLPAAVDEREFDGMTLKNSYHLDISKSSFDQFKFSRW